MQSSEMADQFLSLNGKSCVYREGGTVMMGRVQRVIIEDDWGAWFVIDIIPTEGFQPITEATIKVGSMWDGLSINEQGVHARFVNFSIIIEETLIEKIEALVLQGLDDNDFIRELIRVQYGV